MRSIFCTIIALWLSLPVVLFASELDGKRVGDIGISGNYPYVEHKIRKYISARPGDIYSPQSVEEQLRRVKEFYVREGWFDTVVTATSEYKPDYDSVTIHFKINRGFLLRYRNIDVVGNYSLPKSLVASKINTWKSYKLRKLRESMRAIVNTYRKKGYPLARVKVLEKNIDFENHEIDVTVQIDEGPFVTVDFMGNEHIGGLILKKVITIFREGAIDTFELEESVKAIEKRYKERGFPDTKVTFKREEISKNRLAIKFDISEGQSQRIRAIDFAGNKDISTARLRDRMVTRSLSFTKRGIFDRKVLNNDLKRIQIYYRSKGYLDAATQAPEIETADNKSQLIITIPVDEGIKVEVGSILFSGAGEFSDKTLLKKIKSRPEKPLNINILADEQENLIGFYGDRGYPYVKVEFEVKRGESSQVADLEFKIDTGPKVYFGDISMVGDFLTSQKAIKKAAGIKNGEEFSYAKLVNAKISLRRLGAFASVDVDPIGLANGETTIPIEIKVEEMRPFRLDLEAGYSTDESFIGTLDFTNLNAFGWGKRTSLRLTGGRKLTKGEISWIDPKFLGHDLEMSASGWLQYRDKNVFTYIQGGGGVGLYRRYHRTSFFARAEINRNYFVQGSSTAADSESLRNNTITETSLSMTFDTRNSFVDPTQGLFTGGYSNFFNEIKGNNAHFVRLGLMDGFYYSWWKRFTLANDFRFENIQTFGKNVSVPSNELLLLGGDDTIRGFDENSLGPRNAAGAPTGGRLRFICNNELRITLFDHFRWVFFHDMGFLTDSYSAVTLGTLRHSAGFGIHYITPIGPIKVDYGFIIDRRPGEHIGRFHLTFGYTF